MCSALERINNVEPAALLCDIKRRLQNFAPVKAGHKARTRAMRDENTNTRRCTAMTCQMERREPESRAHIHGGVHIHLAAVDERERHIIVSIHDATMKCREEVLMAVDTRTRTTSIL